MLHAWLNVLCVQLGPNRVGGPCFNTVCVFCTDAQNVWINWLKWSLITCFGRLSLFMCITTVCRKMSESFCSHLLFGLSKQRPCLKFLWDYTSTSLAHPRGILFYRKYCRSMHPKMKKKRKKREEGGFFCVTCLLLGNVYTVNVYIVSFSLCPAGLGAF